MPLDVEVERTDGVAVLHARGELELATATQFQSALTELIEDGGVVVVDCAEVTFIDSSALRVLVQARLRLESSALLRLIIPRPSIRRIFELSGLAPEFSIYDSFEDALRAS